MLPIYVRLPSAYSENDDGDDELDSDSSSLDANTDENINENVKKGICGVKNIQAVRSVTSDSTEDFNQHRNIGNISCQRNILSRHIEKTKSSISDTRYKKNTNQNKIHRFSRRGIFDEVYSSQMTPKFTSVSGEQLYDSGTSEDVSDNYLGQVEGASSSSILKAHDPEDHNLHRQSITDDNFTEAQSLLTSHNAESSGRKNSDKNGQLFKLSEKAFKSKNKQGESASEIQCQGCFLAADDVNTQSGKVESGTVTQSCGVEGTDHAIDLIKQQLPRNLAGPRTSILFRSSIKLKDNKIATTEIISRNAQRKLQKNNTLSNNTNTRTKLAEVHRELKSSSEHGDLTSESVVSVGSSNKKYGNHILNRGADSRIMATSHSKHDHRSVPVVTVDYQNEEGIKELKPNCLRNKVNSTEVKALDSTEQNNYPCSMLTVYKSSKEKNYYEVARRPTSGTVLRECVAIPEENSEQQDTYTLLKTTRRLEFMRQAPDEIISKRNVQPVNQPKLLPVDVKPQTCFVQEYEPVRIKKPRNRISSAPKERYESRSKATSGPDLLTSREMVWSQNQKNKPKIKNRNVTGKEKPLSAMTYSHGGRIASAPNPSLRQKPLVQDSLAEEIQTIQSKMASLGANDGIEALERAVFTTSGRMMYRQAASYLPSDPSYGLIPHYKHWLPEEYMILQAIKKKLGDDDHHKRLRSLRTAQKMKKLTVGDVHKILRRP